jgi:serine/threonine protein phosphatase 1
MSDLHGCYEEYIKALDAVHFSSKDVLFVLGDIVDRGPEPIRILRDMMYRDNVYPLLGNHEYSMMTVVRKLGVEITDETIAALTGEDLESARLWLNDGGMTTLKGFLALKPDEREDLMEYMGEFSLYEEIEAGGREYVLVHAGLDNFAEDRDLDSYDLSELIFHAPDYDKVYFKDRYLVTGHRPTLAETAKGRVLEQNNHIAVDCGCVFGGRLAVYCLDNGRTVYIDKV